MKLKNMKVYFLVCFYELCLSHNCMSKLDQAMCQDQRAFALDVIHKNRIVCSVSNFQKSIEHPRLSTSKNQKDLKATRLRSISTSTVAKKSVALVELMPLMGSDFNSTRQNKFTDFINRSLWNGSQRSLAFSGNKKNKRTK